MFRSVESLMLAEFAADAAVLWTALRGKYRIKLLRLFTAAAVGAAVSVYASVVFHSRAAYLISALWTAPVMLIICTGRTTLSEFICTSASLLAVSALMAASANIFGGQCLLSILAAALVGRTVISIQHRWLDTWEAEIEIRFSGCSAYMDALIDTGNRLTEPISGLPVIVAEEAALTGLIPDDLSLPEKMPGNFRRIAYGGVGGDGTLMCFMPDAMSVNGKSAKDIWVAVYPGRLPGKFGALAPPALMRTTINNRNGGR